MAKHNTYWREHFSNIPWRSVFPSSNPTYFVQSWTSRRYLILPPWPLQVTSHCWWSCRWQLVNSWLISWQYVKCTTVCCKPVESCTLYMLGTARKQIKSTSSEKINFLSHNHNLEYSTYTVKIKLLRSMFTDSLQFNYIAHQAKKVKLMTPVLSPAKPTVLLQYLKPRLSLMVVKMFCGFRHLFFWTSWF